MRSIFFTGLLFVSIFVACNEDTNNKNYYPVQAWIAAELKNIDSLNLPIIHISNGQNDSLVMPITEFKKMAMGLFSVDLGNEMTKNNYTEEVLDEGDNTNISITYTAEEKSIEPLRKIQVNIQPGQSTPKSIYAERTDLSGKMIINRKIIWERGHSLTVASAYFQDEQLIRESKEKFEW